MTKMELFAKINKEFDKQSALLAGETAPDDISTVSALALIESSGNIVNEISQYLFDVIPTTEKNAPHILASFKRITALFESTLDEDQKQFAEELLIIVNNITETTIVKVPDKETANDEQ
jgi:hypothetical protein